MCLRFSDWLYRVTGGWVALLALAVSLLFFALVLPNQATIAGVATGDGGTPDLSLCYSADDLYRMAESFGERGRAAYVRARFTFDLIWPLVYALFLTTAITWLYGLSLARDSRWRRANLAPVIGALLDYLENISTSVVMLRYPDRTPVIDTLASVFTLVKWILVGGSFVLLLAGVAIAVRQRFRKRSHR